MSAWTVIEKQPITKGGEPVVLTGPAIDTASRLVVIERPAVATARTQAIISRASDTGDTE